MVSACFDGKFATRNRGLFMLGVSTGGRISELLSFRLGDVYQNSKPVSDLLYDRSIVKAEIEKVKQMSTPPIYQLSDLELQECVKYSRDFLLAVDETIKFIPYNASDSTKRKILRFLFMDTRSAAYDICVLAESLLTDDSHLFSRAIESSRRLLMENTIDYFYISESDDSVAKQRMDFMRVVNTSNDPEKERAEKAFKKKYKVSGRGDFWSGKSREEKIEQDIQKYPPMGNDKSFANTVKPIFDYLNEQVHGNTMVALYFTFDKQGKYSDEYREQAAVGLQHLLFFYLVLHTYCNFNSRGSEIKRFDFYYGVVAFFYRILQ